MSSRPSSSATQQPPGLEYQKTTGGPRTNGRGAPFYPFSPHPRSLHRGLVREAMLHPEGRARTWGWGGCSLHGRAGAASRQTTHNSQDSSPRMWFCWAEEGSSTHPQNHSLEMVLQRHVEVKGITSVPKANSNKCPSPWGRATVNPVVLAENPRRATPTPHIPLPSSMRTTKYLLESVTLSTAVPGNWSTGA